MANTPTRMSRAALGTSSATLYTVPAATTAIVTEIIFANTNTTDTNVTLVLGGTTFLSNTPVPAGGLMTIGMKQVLSATDTITGLAAATGVNVFISGVQVA